MPHHRLHTMVCLLALAACDAGSESATEVAGTQDGVAVGERLGAGVMRPWGVDIPDLIQEGDMTIMIRSFSAEQCEQIDSSNVFEAGPEGFSWMVFLSVPAEKLVASSSFRFSEVLANIETAGRYPTSPGSDWYGDFGCDLYAGDDPLVEVLEVAEAKVVIRLSEACVADWGFDIPMEEQGVDHVPPPAVHNQLDGEYEITLCDAPSATKGG